MAFLEATVGRRRMTPFEAGSEWRSREARASLDDVDAAVRKSMVGGLAPWRLAHVCRHVERRLASQLTNSALASLVRLSEGHFARAFRRKDPHCLAAAVSPQRRKVTLQKFVPGRPAASAFAAWNGEVVGAVYYDVLKADGAIGPPSVVPYCPMRKGGTAGLPLRSKSLKFRASKTEFLR